MAYSNCTVATVHIDNSITSPGISEVLESNKRFTLNINSDVRGGFTDNS